MNSSRQLIRGNGFPRWSPASRSHIWSPCDRHIRHEQGHCTVDAKQWSKPWRACILHVLYCTVQKDQHLLWKYNCILTKSLFDRLTAPLKRIYKTSQNMKRGGEIVSVKAFVSGWKSFQPDSTPPSSVTSAAFCRTFRPWKMFCVSSMNNVDGAALHQSVPVGVLYLMVLLQHCYPRMVFAQLVIGCCKEGACCH